MISSRIMERTRSLKALVSRLNPRFISIPLFFLPRLTDRQRDLCLQQPPLDPPQGGLRATIPRNRLNRFRKSPHFGHKRTRHLHRRQDVASEWFVFSLVYRLPTCISE